MSASTIRVGGVDDAVRPEGEGSHRGFHLRRRHLWLVPGLAIAIYANVLGQGNGVGILALLAFGIAPDLPRLLGARGRSMHNLLHQPLAPIVAVAVTATGVVPVVWLVGALVWLGHLVAGRGIGDVPRPTADRAGERTDA
jgi:hypothetical protein